MQPFKDSSEFTIGYMDSFVDHAWGPDGRIFCVFMDQDPATLNKLVLLVKDKFIGKPLQTLFTIFGINIQLCAEKASW